MAASSEARSWRFASNSAGTSGGIVFDTSTTLQAQRVNHYSTLDLRVGYSSERRVSFAPFLKGWRIAAGINNVFDRMPPLSPQAFSDNNADVSTYSPIGRLIYATAALKF